MKNQSDQIALLHLKWQELTKLNRPFNCSDYFPWELWLSRGYTSADLELVIGYIWARIKDGKRQKESFKLSNLLEPSRFADDLAFARPAQREVKATPKDKILAAIGWPKQDEKPARTAAEVMASHETMARMLKEYREKNL
jgi:hypothetical protein